MRCYPISTRINRVANDDEACSRPVELAQIQEDSESSLLVGGDCDVRHLEAPWDARNAIEVAPNASVIDTCNFNFNY